MPRMQITTVRQAIEEIGGYRVAAEMLGVERDTIYQWAHTDKFPAKTIKLKALLEARGHSVPDSLWGLIEVNEA